MAAIPISADSDITVEPVTLADIRASIGTDPDPTGDFAAGRTTFHESTEAFLTCLRERDNGLVDE